MSGTLLAQAASVARAALAWWVSELVALIPASLRHLFGVSDRLANVLEFGADPVLRRCDSSDAVAVHFDPALVFQTSLTLSLSARRNLRAIVHHQIERLVPIAVSEICFDCRAVPPTPGAKSLTVELAVAKRATVEDARALARSFGLRPIRVLAPPGGSGAALVLWEQSRASAGTRTRILRRGLEIAAAALLLISYGLHVHRLDRIRDALHARVARSEQSASAARALERTIAHTQAAVAFLDRRGGSVPPLRVLDALTRLVPLDSWATRFDLRGHRVEIAGYGPRATDLIARIERSALFERPQFQSPITLAPDGSGEQFDISFAVRAGAGR